MDLLIKLLSCYILNQQKRKQRRQYLKCLINTISPVKTHFDLILSIGSDCETSYQLRTNGLQVKSYPMDWLCGNNICGIQKIFENNFDRFLELEDLKIVTKAENLIVQNSFTNYTFLHDFEKDTIEEDYKEIKEKYARRINRLKQAFDRLDKILLVYKNINNTDEELKIFYQVVCKKYPNKEIHLWSINYCECNEIKKRRITDHLYVIEFNNKSPDNSWTGNSAIYKKLYSELALSLKGLHFSE